ncbi:excisionase [Yersinia ruckeri]|uniref:excisionase n=1 Tax=Yersinia ruckeri TaxID=29486 RepID=UPI0004E3582E|nr:excisionase [Yersinia ruckeri]ARZ01354.1 excisionase [Yersinia ruckeri]EKN4697354.1 excisionase [Yersinia ruckeri]ELM3738768.1 excisionase [Yersinia ruckeri]KFE38877.1 excisionase [Yersinia ruckeri]MCW6546245.1 excisionase [Yersinia ruckeri]
MLQMLKLEEWAIQKYRSDPPSLSNLRQRAKAGHFSPPAKKEGRWWRVREDAELVGSLAEPEKKKNDNPRLQRILSDGCQTSEK